MSFTLKLLRHLVRALGTTTDFCVSLARLQKEIRPNFILISISLDSPGMTQQYGTNFCSFMSTHTNTHIYLCPFPFHYSQLTQKTKEDSVYFVRKYVQPVLVVNSSSRLNANANLSTVADKMENQAKHCFEKQWVEKSFEGKSCRTTGSARSTGTISNLCLKSNINVTKYITIYLIKTHTHSASK